jgi:selenocysteine-specific elongation factor
VRVRSVQTHGVSAERAEAGQRTALNVSGIKKENLHRGQAVASPGVLVESACVNVRLRPLLAPKHGERVRVHIGSGEFIGRLFLFDAAPDFAQLRLEEAVACVREQRLVLRRFSPPVLLAGGEIVTPAAKPRRKGDAEILAILGGAADGAPDADPILAFVQAHPGGVPTERICEAVGSSPPALGDRFEALRGSGELLGFAGMWITDADYPAIADRLRQAALRLHESSPREPAVAKRDLNRASGLSWDAKAFDRLCSRLDADGLLVVHGSGVRHPDFEIKLSDKQRDLLSRTLDAMRAGGATAPDAAAIGAALAVPPQAVEEMWRLGVAADSIVKVGDGLYYTRDTLDDIHALMRTLGERFTVAMFRDATGSSRKFALPLLQWFDEARVTKRVGDERLLLR